MIRPTRWGWTAGFLTGLALFSAGSTGNNLLYLLFGVMAALLAVSAAAGAVVIRGVAVECRVCDGPVAGGPARLVARLSHRWPWDLYGLAVRRGAQRVCVPSLEAGASAEAALRVRLPWRGLNEVGALVVECLFPFGLVRHARRVAPALALAWPRTRPVRAQAELRVDGRAGGRPVPRKGAGDELYGLRELAPGDDAKLIHWKLSAKRGCVIVAEYGATSDPRIVLDIPRGAEADEALIEETASAAEFFLDEGAEVSLRTGEGEVGFGRGRAQLERIMTALARLGLGARPRAVPLERTRPPSWEPAAPPPDWTLLLSGVVLASIGLIDEIPPRLAALGAPVMALAWAARSRRAVLLPAAAWSLLSVVVLAWTTAFDWRASGLAIANVHLILYLLACRALTPFRDGELGQGLLIPFLGFFLVSGLTISLWYFASFLAFGACAAAWLAMACGAAPARWRSWAKATAASCAATLALAAATFVVTPRLEGFRRINPFLAAGIDKLSVKNSSVTGFTENVSLGWFGELKKSSARVMRVAPVGWGGGRPGPMLVRGGAFEVFDGARWSRADANFAYRMRGRLRRTTFGRAWIAGRTGQLRFPVEPPRVAVPPVEISLYPMNLSVLFTVGTPWLVEGIDDAAWFDVGDGVKLATPYITGLRYRVYGNPARRGFGSEILAYEDLVRAVDLTLPPDPGGKMAALARKAAEQAQDPEAKIRAVVTFLQRRYSYSLYSDGRGVGLDEFLFKSRRGNCEYFATAAVLLLRHAGVPARLVTGFLADDWNEYGRFFDVRQNEAHAWAEAYVPGRGWLSVEATPAQGAFSASADAFGRRLERWFEAAQTQWYRHVIGYDQGVQSDTFRRLGRLFSPDEVWTWARRLGRVAAALGLAWAGLLGLRRLSRARPAGFFERAQAALERAGLRRQPYWTAREFAVDVVRRRPELAAISALAELHYRARYRAGGLSAAERARSLSLLGELRRRL